MFTSDLQLGGVRKPVGGGVRSASGSVWIAHDGSAPLTSLAQDAAVSGQSVYLRSDRLDLSKGHVDAGGGGAILLPGDPWPIDLGATNDDWGSLNLSAAEGHPALVMDMSFANQALGIEYAVQHAAELERRVYPVPAAIDAEIARLKLETMGIEIDQLTEEQAKYLASWDEGT